MNDQGGSPKEKISFQCQYCNVSLTVAASLAGVTGPCPSCGREIAAPMPGVAPKVELRPREPQRRPELSNDARRPATDRGGRRRSLDPNIGTSQDYRDRAEVATVVKMLIASLVVLAIVILIAWWLTTRVSA